MGNKFQDLLQLRETADNTERYIRVTYEVHTYSKV
jgi:hypothetical protein